MNVARKISPIALAGIVLLGQVGWTAPAFAANNEVLVAETPRDHLTPVQVRGVDDPHSFRFAAEVPAGGRLKAVGSPSTGAEFSSEILVEDARGAVVGAYDTPYAIDGHGTLLAASYRIDGTSLVQNIKTSQDAAFPILVLFSDYQPVKINGSPSASFVSVPSNYVYNPSMGSLHDYCTSSPDSFFSADFRGPCARHDLCYEAPGNHKAACDNGLRSNLDENCDSAYGPSNPLRATCRATADVYWAAVTAFGDDNLVLRRRG